MSAGDEQIDPFHGELNRVQRRILGTLSEKAFTTPAQYPLTPKALLTGCNQTSNRSPVTNYGEDQVQTALDELQENGLLAVVHTESGRTERYRHYLRKRFPLSEPQLAILTELLLRGRQTVGELRARAARMVPIEGLGELRTELQGMIDLGYVRSSGPLERRGVEVDHALYTASERATSSMDTLSGDVDEAASVENGASPSPDSNADLDQLRTDIEKVNRRVELLVEEFESLSREFGRLRDSLGG
ncbi:DUF480 domain-containing protein [Stratiformator vulcanicus]|uniref:DUF480 domain-containing protein n=1 Tax=Stratiformator vulcanicus TaxID=2527980 RepID=A0A517R491_9PLAN|nr:DUF480 domain-containing protein [Stratiformator vulcanicus]QDT38643.1 hypothetical protein Pan189_30380 [Stratiformator vulcanicus]